MTDVNELIRQQAIAHVRGLYAAESADQTDDEVWAILGQQPVTLGLLMTFVGPLIEVIGGLETRIIALENPKQLWETE